MKNFSSCIAISTMVLLFALSAAALAAVRCLDDDPNYPPSYFHANHREYVDLSSCVWNAENEDYDVYTTGYIDYVIGSGDGHRQYKTRTFRQAKDGSEPPQFLNPNTNEWVSFPVFDREEIRQYMKQHGYLGYIDHYHAFAYYMFKTVYKQTRGEEFPDRLYGETP